MSTFCRAELCGVSAGGNADGFLVDQGSALGLGVRGCGKNREENNESKFPKWETGLGRGYPPSPVVCWNHRFIGKSGKNPSATTACRQNLENKRLAAAIS